MNAEQLAMLRGATVVVKYGGNAMTNETLKQAVMDDVRVLHQAGVRVAVVHGGGPAISAGLKAIGKQSEFIDGLRVTDAETIDVVTQMLAGQVNKSLVAQLGAQAVGISGVDGGLFQARPLENAALGFVGEVEKVEPALLNLLLDNGFIPVISTIGVQNGQRYNINADTAASQVAIALQASHFINMTDIAGVLRDVADESSLIPEIKQADYAELVQSGVISGGMIPKLACCVDVIQAGVAQAAIVDGRVPHALLTALTEPQCKGTRFVR